MLETHAYPVPGDDEEFTPNLQAVDQRAIFLEKLWRQYRPIAGVLREAKTDEQAREGLEAHFARLERLFESKDLTIHPLSLDLAAESIKVARTIMSPRSKKLSGFNLIRTLRELADPHTSREAVKLVELGFLMELERLWAGCHGKAGVYRELTVRQYEHLSGRESAWARGDDLDRLARRMHRGLHRFASGLDAATIRLRHGNKRRILKAYGVGEKQWQDWMWQVRHVVRNADDLARLVDLSPEERAAIEMGVSNRLPFGVTPYYAHLMDRQTGGRRDRAVRCQVIPPREYVEQVSAVKRRLNPTLDFMQERDTSPCDLITRRYAAICILKPSNTCSQVCVYCQRNWEIEGCYNPRAVAHSEQLDAAINYIARHSAIREVLVTGGDPLILSEARLKVILDRLADIPHLERIRIGTRTPVVLPMRITDALADLLAGYRILGKRDLCVVTHFEHVYEVTPEAAEAVERLRRRGLSVYNQVVFTFANSRRFELVALRRALRLIGVENYYTFAPQGKEETNWYRIPIARLLQEPKEEGRLTPGMIRTDETVYNVPRLGKNYLNRQQDHSVIALLPDGRRLYEFHPWEKKLALAGVYLHRDVSIYEYLNRLKSIGENPRDYSSIWYYY